MVRRLFADMFLEVSHEALKERLMNRAQTFARGGWGTALCPSRGRDAGQMDAALSQGSVLLLALQSTYFNPERVRVSLHPGATTPWTERVKRAVPTSQIEIISGVGHFPMLEVPAMVHQAIATFVAQF